MFSLTMKTGNAAFQEDNGEATPEALGAEIARILRDVAEHAENGATSGPCLDVNGNLVGEWEVTTK